MPGRWASKQNPSKHYIWCLCDGTALPAKVMNVLWHGFIGTQVTSETLAVIFGPFRKVTHTTVINFQRHRFHLGTLQQSIVCYWHRHVGFEGLSFGSLWPLLDVVFVGPLLLSSGSRRRRSQGGPGFCWWSDTRPRQTLVNLTKLRMALWRLAQSLSQAPSYHGRGVLHHHLWFEPIDHRACQGKLQRDLFWWPNPLQDYGHDLSALRHVWCACIVY